MLGKIRAIVISSIPYSENSVVLKCYTDVYGLQSYLINGVRSKKGSIKPSQLMALSLLELDTYHQQNKNLQRIKELKCNPPLHHLHFDLFKSSIAIFISELLSKSLKEENQVDQQLFDFLFNSIQYIDLMEEGLANIPCFFLVHLSKYLGFFPELNMNTNRPYFSLREGIFVESNEFTPETISLQESAFLRELLAANLSVLSAIKTTRDIRKSLLESMLRYYQIHLQQFHELNSHKILSEVF
ncbi:MAG: DNA repair protein RecO [Bacteroidia bacterium]